MGRGEIAQIIYRRRGGGGHRSGSRTRTWGVWSDAQMCGGPMPAPGGNIWSNHIGLSMPIQQTDQTKPCWPCDMVCKTVRHLLVHWGVIHMARFLWRCNGLSGLIVKLLSGFADTLYNKWDSLVIYILYKWVPDISLLLEMYMSVGLELTDDAARDGLHWRI